MEFIYRLIARVLAIPAVCNAVVGRAQKTPYRNIFSRDGKSLYMIRYWLFNPYELEDGSRPRRSWLREQLPSARVHIILRPDTDSEMHDHPWDARTFIMKRYYVERRQRHDTDYEGLDYFTRRAGQTVSLKYGEYHSITEVPHAGVVTLFVTWKYMGAWGFLVNGKKIPWMQYLKEKQDAVADVDTVNE